MTPRRWLSFYMQGLLTWKKDTSLSVDIIDSTVAETYLIKAKEGKLFE